ncbi:MAG: transglycosylase SLT domain-containing protein [Gemmatimonadaceae bacterium]|nr:transglycosylase SLT domain-containing protein [Gemmatimonadaceae bacterium]
MLPPQRVPRVAIWCLLGVAACRSAPPTPVATPASAARIEDRPAAVESRPISRAPVVTPKPVTTDDDLARAVVAVFGDTAALHPDSTSGADAEPVWDINVRSYETHERVAHYVQLFTTDGRERFAARLSRGSRYEPMIRSKLRASGMPEDLTYLALIESGYDPHAYSRAAAVGMWQFMSSTARGVGLRVDWWMDERRDPVRSTEGAIRFLGFLQKEFGSLYLAAAAYNGGPGRVARGLTRFASELEGAAGEDRFFALAEQDYLRAETKNYVPQLIAAALVAKLPGRYGLSVDSSPPLSYDSVRVPAGTSLAAVATASGATNVVMKDLNPAILRGVTPPDGEVWVHVPSGTGERAASQLDGLSMDQRLGYRTVRVSGAALTPVALSQREGVTAKQLRWYNPTLKTTRKGRLVAGQSVRIPVREVFAFARDLPDPSIERYGGESAAALTRSGYHVVRRGETLGGIAKRYHLTVQRLQALNGLRGSRVLPGQTLRVSSGKGSSASAGTSAKRASGSRKAVSRKVTSQKTTTATKAPSAKKAPIKKSSGKTPPAKRKTAAKR